MRLTDTMIRLAWSRPKSRKVLLPMVKVASQGLSTLDVRIFDFVRNQFLEEAIRMKLRLLYMQARLFKTPSKVRNRATGIFGRPVPEN